MPGIFHFNGVVKHYDWGGFRYIPDLLKQENKTRIPFAEYWMGSHPLGDAQVMTDESVSKPLSSLTTLTYLFKILDVKDMLSIQVHPGKQAAEEEFAREEKERISLNDPGRNYKDDNHKPELMVALGDFWLLHGFKPPEEMTYTLLNVVELRELLAIFNESGYKGLYTHVMTISQAEVNRILQPLLDNLVKIYTDEGPAKEDEDFWVTKAAKQFTRNGDIDRGIFSIYLLNLVHLKKGEGIFQAAGVPHAYLEGQNVEIMSNSDNVLRGGLTTKHIDVNELLKHVKCEPTYPNILYGDPSGDSARSYKVPVPDFNLERIDLKENVSVMNKAIGSEILLVTEGKVFINERSFTLEAGQPSALVLPGSEYSISGLDPESVVFRATGVNK